MLKLNNNDHVILKFSIVYCVLGEILEGLMDFKNTDFCKPFIQQLLFNPNLNLVDRYFCSNTSISFSQFSCSADFSI